MIALCCRLLEWMLAPDIAAHVVGDLLEQRRRGRLWFARETLSALWHLRTDPQPGDGFVRNFAADLKLAVRLLHRAPTYALAVIVTLGLAIGATTAIFSVIEPVLIKPLPYPDADRLAFVWERESNGASDRVGFLTFRDMVSESRTLDHAAAIASWEPTIFAPGNAERVMGDKVSWTYFRTLGVHPALGRDFLAEEDTPTSNLVVILSHGLWMRRFNGDSSIVGRDISIAGTPMRVAGVMPPSFDNVASPNAEIWRPLGYRDQPWTCRTCHHLRMIARVRSGVTMDAAAAELTSIHQRLERAFPQEYSAVGSLVVPMQSELTREYRPALMAIAGAVALMLLIAVANVVSLQLARAVRRQDEFAVRTALGAARSRLATQLFAEGLVLATLGGIVGVAVARVTLPVLIGRLPDQLPRLGAIHLDLGALAVVTALVLALSVVLGLAPLVTRARDLADSLRAGRRISGNATHVLRSSFVIGEIALAMMLLVSAGLVGRSLIRLLSVDPGFDTGQLLTMEINGVGPAYADAAVVRRYFDRVQDAVRAVPGVLSVASTNQLPLSPGGDLNGILDPNNLPSNPELSPNADRYAVASNYLASMRIPLLRGRFFTETDAADTVHMVTIISATLAENLWPHQDAIGRTILTGGLHGVTRTVIGVVGDVRHHGLDATVNRQFYVPTRQWSQDNSTQLVVRTSGDPLALAPAVNHAARSIDPSQPITFMVTMDQMIARSTAQRRLALVLFGTFAAAALILAMAGVYGVLAGSVAERTREIGVRGALGASPRDIVAMIVGQGGRMTVIGLVLGVAGSAALTRYLRSLLYGVGPGDPTTMIGVVLVIGVTTIAACLIPARRAASVEPSRALRSD